MLDIYATWNMLQVNILPDGFNSIVDAVCFGILFIWLEWFNN